MNTASRPDPEILWVVAAALIDGDGRVLVQRRAATRSMAGLWEFPGGKVEAGELPETALIRELREELGIHVTQNSLVPAGFASEALGEKHLLMLLYICKNWTGVPQALDADALRWVRPSALHGFAMPPADQPLINQLIALV